jgi:signal transduction histidine kinase
MRTRVGLLVQPEVVEELEGRFSGIIPTFQAGLRSIMTVPLISRDQVIGALHLRSKEPKAYTDRDLGLAERIGDQIAGAIANAQLYIQRERTAESLRRTEEAARRLAQETAVIAQIGQITSSTLDLDVIYERFAQEAKKLIEFDRITVGIIDRKENRVTLPYVWGMAIAGRQSGDGFPLPGSLSEELLKRRSSIVIQMEDEQEFAPRFPSQLPFVQAGLRSTLLIPLIAQDTIIGNLVFYSKKSNAYTDHDLKIAESIGYQVAGAIANAQLFRDRKRAEEALQRSEKELKAQAQELQKELIQRRRAEEELARSNKELGQFAYVASHDLQEPLRMVTSYVQLLARRYRGKLDGDADEFIAFAVNGATRMQQLINDLLTYSRVGTRGKEFEPTDCEIILQQSLKNLQIAVEEKQAIVSHDPLPTLMADHVQLGQLFQNLIGNALKFQGAEPPHVHVSANRNGNGWVFSVRDNGIGIALEYAERIFVIFQRLHSLEKYPGTGIGLAVCKKIVERHGGRIWVESDPGKGATFYFTLPGKGEQ